jgi:uncharacterized protein (DUF302 family)
MPQYKKPTRVVIIKKNDYMRRRQEIEIAALKVENYQLKKNIADMRTKFIEEIAEFQQILNN